MAYTEADSSLHSKWTTQLAQDIHTPTLHVPYRHSDKGWFDYNPLLMGVPTALWHHSASDTDRQRIEHLREAAGYDWRTVRPFRSKEEAGHEEPWFAFLAGDDPDYPQRILAAAQAQIRHRLARMQRYRDLEVPEADIHLWQQSNPVVTEALVQLTWGGPQVIYNGGLQQARVRYYDADKHRPGLPPSIAALVSNIDPHATTLELINLHPTDTHTVIVQAGAFAEHTIHTVQPHPMPRPVMDRRPLRLRPPTTPRADLRPDPDQRTLAHHRTPPLHPHTPHPKTPPTHTPTDLQHPIRRRRRRRCRREHQMTTVPHQRSDAPNRRSGGAVLDSHVHFWDPRRISYPWLSEAPPLNRPYTPDEFASVRSRDTSVIFVEAGRAEQHASAEIEWVRDEAQRHPWIVGAVAHVPLEDPATSRGRDPPVRGRRVRRRGAPQPPGRAGGLHARCRLPRGCVAARRRRTAVRRLRARTSAFRAGRAGRGLPGDHHRPRPSRQAEICGPGALAVAGGAAAAGGARQRRVQALRCGDRSRREHAAAGRHHRCCTRSSTSSARSAACTGATGR